MRFDRAIALSLCGLSEPYFGELSTQNMQLCPQNTGRLTEELAETFANQYGEIAFRLHANVRVLEKMMMTDASNFAQHLQWFEQAVRVHRALGARAYSLHAGSRANCTLDQMFVNLKRIEDLFECPVGVEGMYPSPRHQHLLSSWEEYEQLLQSGAHYAIDMSHLNILAHVSGQIERTLVAELLSSDRCIEIHVSHNDGLSDLHQVMQDDEDAPHVWWLPLMRYINQNAVLFSEGNQRNFKNSSFTLGV